MPKVATCLWFGPGMQEAMAFYVSLVAGSRIDHVLRAPGRWPGGPGGDVILVDFTLGGQAFRALHGGAPADYGMAASISVSCGPPGRGRPPVGGADRRRRRATEPFVFFSGAGRALAETGGEFHVPAD